MTNCQLKFPYSEEEEKELFAIRRRFQDEPVTSVIVQEYQTALKEQTSLTAVAAQEELARRGDYNYIGDILLAALADNQIQYQTALCERIAKSLSRFEDGAILKRFGNHVLWRMANGDTGPVSFKSFVESF